MEAVVAMRWIGVLGLGFGLAGFGLCGGTARAQAQQGVAPDALIAELRTLASRANTVFVGQITAIHREGDAIAVSFQVERPVRGVQGPIYTLREWAGRWTPGQTRYQPGQRVLALVYGVSPAGFASPVHGVEGLLPVVVQGADQPELVDVRMVAASVERTPGTPLPTEADGALQLDAVLAAMAPPVAGRRSSLRTLPLPIVNRGPAGMGLGTPQARSLVMGPRPEKPVVRLVPGGGYAVQ